MKAIDKMEMWWRTQKDWGKVHAIDVMFELRRLALEEAKEFAAKCKSDHYLREELALATRAEQALKEPKEQDNRPATPSEGLVEELLRYCNIKWADSSDPRVSAAVYARNETAEAIKEIISRHTGGKGVGA